MVELLGKMPKKITQEGKFAKDFFTKTGDLKAIKKFNMWPLDRVLIEKYHWNQAEAQAVADFILPMLEFVPSKRATAAQMLQHAWLKDIQ